MSMNGKPFFIRRTPRPLTERLAAVECRRNEDVGIEALDLKGRCVAVFTTASTPVWHQLIGPGAKAQVTLAVEEFVKREARKAARQAAAKCGRPAGRKRFPAKGKRI